MRGAAAPRSERSHRGELPFGVFFFMMAPVALFLAVILVSLWILSSSPATPRETGTVLLSTQGTLSTSSSAAPTLGETRQAVLYAGSKDSPTKLVPYPFTIDSGQGMKEQVDRVIQALQGPFDDPKILPTVPKGTRLLAIFLARKRLLVNLSREFGQLHVGGIQGTRLTLHSLVNSLIDLGLAEEVQVLIQGREEIGYNDHLDISKPLGFQTALISGRASQAEVVEGPKNEDRPPTPSPQTAPVSPPPAAEPSPAKAPSSLKPAPSPRARRRAPATIEQDEPEESR